MSLLSMAKMHMEPVRGSMMDKKQLCSQAQLGSNLGSAVQREVAWARSLTWQPLRVTRDNVNDKQSPLSPRLAHFICTRSQYTSRGNGLDLVRPFGLGAVSFGPVSSLYPSTLQCSSSFCLISSTPASAGTARRRLPFFSCLQTQETTDLMLMVGLMSLTMFFFTLVH